MHKTGRFIIVAILLVLLIGSYSGYRYYMDYVIAECYERISDCKFDEKIGKQIECPLCCDKNGEELYDGNRLNECIERN